MGRGFLMKVTLMIGGGVLSLLGVVWILQGLDILKDSAVMSGHPLWIAIGAAVLAVGLVLELVGVRRAGKPATKA